MRLTLDEPTETDAVDLDGRVAREDVLAAVHGERAWLDCSGPGPLFERVGAVTPDVTVRTRTALAVAARSRGATAPQDEEIRRLRARLEAVEGGDVETTTHRRRLAETGADVDRLRERVARLQGRVAALREGDGDSEQARAELATALTTLTERETEQVAARQALDHARERRRERRDHREERRRLADRLANRERAARRHLVEQVEPEYRVAVGALDGAAAREEPFEVSPVTAALAVYRVGDPDTPVVLDCDRFSDARRAADWLDAPVIRV